jgi:HEAT repeat protein
MNWMWRCVGAVALALTVLLSEPSHAAEPSAADLSRAVAALSKKDTAKKAAELLIKHGDSQTAKELLTVLLASGVKFRQENPCPQKNTAAWWSQYVLSNIKHDPLSTLRAAILAESRGWARERMVRIIYYRPTKLDGATAAFLIHRMSTDPWPWVREWCALRIGKMGTAEALAALAKTLKKDRSAGVRIAAAIGLGSYGGEKAYEILKGCKESNTRVALVVYSVMRELKPQDRKPARVRKRVTATKFRTPKEASETLARSLGGDVAADGRAAAAFLLSKADAKSVNRLIDLLVAKEDSDHSNHLGLLFGYMDYDPSVALRNRIAGEKRDWGRKRMLRMLVSRPGGVDRETVKLLHNLVKTSRSPSIRALSVRGMGSARTLEKTEEATLLRVLKDDANTKVRVMAAEALGTTGCTAAAPALRKAVGDSQVRVSLKAIMALGILKDAKAVPLFIEVVKSYRPDSKRPLVEGRLHWLYWSLGEIEDKRAVPVLVGALKDPERYREYRPVAVKALGWIGDLSAVPTLVNLLREDDDYWVQMATVESLGRLTDSEATAALQWASKRHRDIRVREAAAKVLARVRVRDKGDKKRE